MALFKRFEHLHEINKRQKFLTNIQRTCDVVKTQHVETTTQRRKQFNYVVCFFFMKTSAIISLVRFADFISPKEIFSQRRQW